MPEPSGLIAVARLLISPGMTGGPSDAHLRRAVSTAYYAVFHKVLPSAADRFMGPAAQQSPGYGVLYRAFNHGRIKSVCESLNVGTPTKALQQVLGRPAVSPDMRAFAFDFNALQGQRHLADYDPTAVFDLSRVTDIIDVAESALTAFDDVTPDEKADVLALMLVNPRG